MDQKKQEQIVPGSVPVVQEDPSDSALRYRRQIERLLADTGITIDGSRPWDIHVKNPRFFRRVLAQGSLGLGESYMEGWWTCERLDEMLCRLFLADIEDKIKQSWPDIVNVVRARLFNLQKPSRAFQVGQHHYDMGNDLYKGMLGKYLVYSCGYWRHADNLEAAQLAKLDLVCRKLGLKRGMRVLDIGCGWGEAAKFAAQNYGVEVVGITVSEQQADYARELCRGLPVEIRLQDYRELDETFDRIFSIGMFEHVGVKNYRRYLKVVRRCLRRDGLFVLHTIGGNRSLANTDPWIARYIFPNSMVPSAKQICEAMEDLFVFEDWHNFGPDYDRTLMAWFRNFHSHWGEIGRTREPVFYRMWSFFLNASAASFRARKNQLWQLVLSPYGVPGGLRVPR